MSKEVIISDLLNQRQGEEENKAYKKAVARADASVAGVPYKIFWLYNSELDSKVGNYKKQRFIYNNTDACGIAKNSKLGEVLIKRQDGFYNTDKGKFTVNFNSLTTYTPITTPNIDAINGSIEIPNKKPFLFRSAYTLLNLVEEPETEELKLNILQIISDQMEAEALGKELTLVEKEQSRNLYEITRYILDSNELRQQPILDAIQEDIKRSKIFNGVVVIDGGPGTGKTTTLIQRIKFLIDPTIVEYWPKGEELLPKLQGESGWVFFSPNSLLLAFLQNAMINEGLKASTHRSKVWSTFLNSELLIGYELIGPGKPFQLYRQPVESLLNNDPNLLKLLLADFEKYILKLLHLGIEKCRKIKIHDPSLKKAAASLILNSASLIEADSLVRFIQISDNLVDSFGDTIKLQIKDINEQLQKFTDIIIVRLKRDEENYKLFLKHLESLDKNIEIDEDEQEDENDIRNNVESKNNDFYKSIILRRFIKLLLRKYLLNKNNPEEIITEKQQKWVMMISSYCKNLPVENFGNKLNFVKYISPLVSGSRPLFFKRFASMYKGFRKTMAEWFGINGMNNSKQVMVDLLKNTDSRLHYDERCFLILSINNVIRQLQKFNAKAYFDENNSLIIAYKSHQRFIVGIDEASDFSLIELACMHSFSDPQYNCTTLSGDLMQRMTKDGVEDWDKFVNFVGEGDVKKLKISYRQSPTLLNLAKMFYENVTKKKADYFSYTPISQYEPKPLVKKINQHESKIIWIAENILRIYKSYGNKIPSIAIFLPNVDMVVNISNKLKNCDMLADVGIDVQGITEDAGIAQKGKIGIYNIENIKGLEFEAVFFIDIDLIKSEDENLLQKYVYVGLSRAAYYLFLTYTDILPIGLEFLRTFES